MDAGTLEVCLEDPRLGDREIAAVLVALNAVFQVVAYAALAVFYLDTLPGWLGLDTESINVSMARSPRPC